MTVTAGSMNPVVRHLGRVAYTRALADMRAFTDARGPETPDELWVLEHDPVYTLGMGADAAHVLDAGGTPVVRVDRGGQVTWHGPGQLVIYVLVDLPRRGLGVRTLVGRLEQAVIDSLAPLGIVAQRRAGAPGVYVAGRKLAALGLRVRRGRSYHGLAVNVTADLAPFAGINPCGYPGLAVTRLADLARARDCDAYPGRLLSALLDQLALPASRPVARPVARHDTSGPRPEHAHG
jgi:lipoyl(octanoyl) transferase